jgi:hypothetical protein
VSYASGFVCYCPLLRPACVALERSVSVLSLFGDRELVHKALCTSTKNTPITVIPSPNFACNLIFNPSQPLNAAGNRTFACVDWHLNSTRWLSLSTCRARHARKMSFVELAAATYSISQNYHLADTLPCLCGLQRVLAGPSAARARSVHQSESSQLIPKNARVLLHASRPLSICSDPPCSYVLPYASLYIKYMGGTRSAQDVTQVKRKLSCSSPLLQT